MSSGSEGSPLAKDGAATPTAPGLAAPIVVPHSPTRSAGTARVDLSTEAAASAAPTGGAAKGAQAPVPASVPPVAPFVALAVGALAPFLDPEALLADAQPAPDELAPGVGGLPALAAPQAGPALQAAALGQLAGRMVETLTHRPDGATEIALSPEELGRVQMSIQTDAQNPDRVVILLSFDRPETMDLFRRHADELAEAMRAAGFAEADIGFGSSSDGADRDNGPGTGSAARPSSADGMPPAARSGNADPRPHRPVASGSGLDLRL